MNEREQYVWVEKYRPTKIEDIVLPNVVKKQLRGIIKKGELTNLLFYGNVGCGKTTCAKAIPEELGFDYMFINGKNCGIDTARHTLPQYATALSFDNNNRKIIIIDEAEKMSDDFGKALQTFIEEYADNCAFILTTNHPNQLSSAIRSRFNDVCFDITNKDEKKVLFSTFKTKVLEILDKEGITYDSKVVARFIFDYFPDMRKSLNMLQSYSNDNEIDIGILAKRDSEFDELLKLLKAREFRPMIDFIKESELDFMKVSNYFINMIDKFDNINTAMMIKMINEYDYKNAFVVHKQANLLAFLTEVISEVTIP